MKFDAHEVSVTIKGTGSPAAERALADHLFKNTGAQWVKINDTTYGNSQSAGWLFIPDD